MSLASSFSNLSANQKRTTMVVAAIVAILGISILLASVSERKVNRLPRANKAEVTVVSPSRTTGVEAFAAQLANLEKAQQDLKSEMKSVLRNAGSAKPSDQGEDAPKEAPQLEDVLPEISGQTSIFEAPAKKGPELPMTTPAVPVAPRVDAAPATVVPPPAPPTIRMIGEEGELTDEKVSKLNTPAEAARTEKKVESAFVPAGSMFTGVLLSGLDAPTSAVAQKNPTPVVVRVKREAILPNYASLDVRECFVMAAGYGQLSSERALMRAETLSCVRQDGNVIETSLDAYIVGTDGKVGIPGRLVSKQGQMIAQTLVAGTLGGMGQMLGRSRVPQLNINGQGALYEDESMSSIAQTGIAGGIGSATNMIAKFYLDMAKETFPVVEIPAGEVVTVVVTRGSSLPLKGSSSLQRISAPNENQRNAQGTASRAEPPRRVTDARPANPGQIVAPAEAAIKSAVAATAGVKPPVQNFQNGLGW
ncbi:TraB/VirB10 family protein [Simplicispira suum]|uniref:Conjugal transfer protein TraB n=1 Tax=Simplicispira suum TaxID=2109915 RepID=A0A2S0N5X9_9BURK|nr:TraB/VirB10 family protein [Simplicispira suum]AVO43437.1 conjugal transfer protein TraB [Simplicispira suum]